MKLYIGLGNPDKKYQNTRHNVGHLVILELIKNYELKIKNYPNLNSQFVKNGNNIFAITTEFMNNSGISVKKIANYYKIESENIYVIHDDLDIGVGEWKLQFDRGPAGHHGVESVVQHLGTQAFNRIRIGIGKPSSSALQIPVEDYVLQPFSLDEKKVISAIIDQIVDRVSVLSK